MLNWLVFLFLNFNWRLIWRRQWQPTPVLLPGKSHGWRSLVGCSPWGCYELDTSEWLHFHALEKEMATHSSVLAWKIPGTGEPGGLLSMGVAQSRTRLKRLSSSSRRLITLQYCGGFCHTFTWISHGCTCVPHPDPPSHLPLHPIPQGHPSAPALSTLSHASNLDWWSISHMMFQCYSLKSSHPLLLS